MRILFLTHPYPNYVPDLLLHGLRKLLGPDVVDYPRKDGLYQGVLGLGICPPNQLCPGWFPQDNGDIDRQDIETKIERGFFSFIVCDLRAWAPWKPRLSGCRAGVALIDGEDRPFHLKPGNYLVFRRETDGSDYSIPLPMALPEEIFHWIASYDNMPKCYSIGFLGSTHDGRRRALVDALARRYSDCLFSASTVPTPDTPLPQGRLGRDDYYRELQKCRIVLSLAGAGHDTFRFWEHAACNAVHFAQRLPLFIPEDFADGTHMLRFRDGQGLIRCIDQVLGAGQHGQEMIINGRHHLISHHLTIHRARYLLARLSSASG
jgi:hypothetical protein